MSVCRFFTEIHAYTLMNILIILCTGFFMAIFFGGFLGLFIAGVPGLFLGVLIGAMLNNIDFTFIKDGYTEESIIFRNLPVFAAWVTAASGNSRSIVLNIKNFALSTFGSARAKIFMDNYKRFIDSGLSYEKLRTSATEINFSMNIQSKHVIIQILLSVISNRADFIDSDLNSLQEIASLLGLNINLGTNNSYSRTRPREFAEKEKSPYDTLEISPSDSFEDIKKQYRKLSLKYHPDLSSSLSDEERIRAELKMREINNAYDIIKKSRNTK